jgi:hypothetical protein
MAAYRMFPPVGPDRTDELAAGDTSVRFGPYRPEHFMSLGPSAPRTAYIAVSARQ